MKKVTVLLLVICLAAAAVLAADLLYLKGAKEQAACVEIPASDESVSSPEPAAPSARTVPERELQPETIYLTFDDGPSKYTERLLEILDEYNIKATFFVTEQEPDYTCMKKKSMIPATASAYTAPATNIMRYTTAQAGFIRISIKCRKS